MSHCEGAAFLFELCQFVRLSFVCSCAIVCVCDGCVCVMVVVVVLYNINRLD